MSWITDSLIGFLPDVKTELFEVPAEVGGKAVLNFFLKYVVLVNDDDAASIQGTLYATKGAESVPITWKGFNFEPHRDLQGPTLIALQPGDKVEGKASTDNRIAYTITYAMKIEN